MPDTVNFDWEAIEPSEKPDVFATEVFASTLHWLITFCISNTRNKKSKKTLEGHANLKAGYRRFLALVYVYRPDLLDGRSISAMAKDLNVSRQEINKYIADVSLEFKYQGPNQKAESTRAIYRAVQLRKLAEKNKTRKRKSIKNIPKTFLTEKFKIPKDE